MPIIDIIIAVAIVISVIIGILRGFVKEAISIASLLLAIWAALYLGPSVGEVSESWLETRQMQMWFGRILVFAIVISIGALIGWGVSRIVHMSFLKGVDRLAGSAFGAARGVLLAAIFVIGGQFAEFDHERWWQQSKLIPYVEIVADWIKVMAPKGMELLTPEEPLDDMEFDLPEVEIFEGN